jgi:hypothetical protein
MKLKRVVSESDQEGIHQTHMNNYSDYKVEKDRSPVTLFLLDGSVKEGYVYLSLHAATHEGPEMIMDVLNQDEQFLPIDFKERPVRLINKGQIVMISFPMDEVKTGNMSLGETRIHDVTVHLINQGQLEGSFVSLLPTHARRVKDYLNQEESFLELRRDGRIYLINKDHVLFVEEK